MKEWTLLVYMAADNDLSSFGLKDLHEMERLGSTDTIDVIVQIDRYGNGEKGEALRGRVERDPDWKRFEVRSISPLARLGETNTGDPRVLSDFIQWSVAAFPAKRYALVIWSHGSGWKPEFIYKVAEEAAGAPLATAMRNVDFASRFESKLRRIVFRKTASDLVSGFINRSIVPKISESASPALLRGNYSRINILGIETASPLVSAEDELEKIIDRAIALDETSHGDALDSIELKDAIDQAVSAISRTTGSTFKFDIVGFDACLMAGLEVAFQLRDVCDFIVGSEEIEPGVGWRYDLVMESLNSSHLNPRALAEAMVVAYVKGLEDYKVRLITLSAIDVSRIHGAVAALNSLGRIVREMIGSEYGRIAKSEKTATRFYDTDFMDLLDFGQLLADQKHSDELPNILAGFNAAIVSSRFAFPSGRQHPRGLSAYFPTKPIFDPAYNNLDIRHHIGKWMEAIKAYHFIQ